MLVNSGLLLCHMSALTRSMERVEGGDLIENALAQSIFSTPVHSMSLDMHVRVTSSAGR